MFDKKFRLYLLAIAITEAVSFIGFIVPSVRIIGFFLISFVALIFAVEKLEYGLLFLFVEIFISSKGYLFFYEYQGALFSIRIALFLVVMSAWLGKIVLNWIDVSKAPALEIDPWLKKSKAFIQQDLFSASKHINAQRKIISEHIHKNQPLYFYVGLLFLAIAWGLINGLWRHNGFGNIFYDFNGWIYFVIIFPLAYVAKHNNAQDFSAFLNNLLSLFSAAMLWLAIKSILLFFIFSHVFVNISDIVYKWVRISGVGEITATGGGFSRIFIQSQIYALIGLFIFASLLFYALLKKNKQLLFYSIIMSTLCTVMVWMSLSRSFWLGLIIGTIFFYAIIITIFRHEWLHIIKHIMIMMMMGLLGLITLFILAVFPYPQSGMFDAGVFASRMQNFNKEAAVASRWNLLPPLWNEITHYALAGEGFGATVTYYSQDPRILESNPDGKYTTYAFEWGWLDIWLKLGLAGAVIYLLLLMRIIIVGLTLISQAVYRIHKLIITALLSSLIMIATTSFFSPYLNHPLGINFIVLITVIFVNYQKVFKIKVLKKTPL